MAAISALPAGCLLMAAGNASRFGENKLAACFDGQSLFSLALAAIPAEMFARVTVVSQYPALLEEASLAGFDTILNDRPEDGIRRTIRWYLEHEKWWKDILAGEYQDYYEKMYGNRGKA